MICAAVLAGGRSSRMGRDKATLVVGSGGERLVDRVARAAAGALREAGERAPRVLVSGAVEGYECVPDGAEGLGPVAGIAAVLERALATPRPPEWLIFLPVDLPRITLAALRPLVSGVSARPGDDAAPTALHFAGHALPAVLRCDERTRGVVRDVLASEGRERSVTRLLALLGAEVLPLDAAGAAALANANTPEELREALGPGGGR